MDAQNMSLMSNSIFVSESDRYIPRIYLGNANKKCTEVVLPRQQALRKIMVWVSDVHLHCIKYSGRILSESLGSKIVLNLFRSNLIKGLKRLRCDVRYTFKHKRCRP